MSTIAVIDDMINERYLHHRSIKKRFLIRNGEVREIDTHPADICTHATICAVILEQCAVSYDIINISIMEAKKPTDIRSLLAALELCVRLDVDIVHLSVGSVFLSDSLRLNGVIQTLLKNHIILIAALSNENQITLPASYPQVIGVRSDTHHILRPYEIIVDPKDPWGAQVTANCAMDLSIPGIQYYPSNSFAVPVVTSYVNRYANHHICRPADIMAKLRADSNKEVLATALQRKYDEIEKADHSCHCMVPQICVVANGMAGRDAGLELMNILGGEHDIEVAGLSGSIEINDVRFFTVHNFGGSLEKAVVFIEKHTQIELILLLLTEKEWMSQTTDDISLAVRIGKNNQADILSDDRVVFSSDTHAMKEIAGQIIHLLT